MGRRSGFSSIARSAIRAAAQAERAQQTASRRHEQYVARAQKLAHRQHLLSRAEEAEELTVEIRERENMIGSLLTRALQTDPRIRIKEFHQRYIPQDFDQTAWVSRAPQAREFLPKPPGILVRWFSKSYKERVREAINKLEAAKAVHDSATAAAKISFGQKQQEERERIVAHNEVLDGMESRVLACEHEATVTYYKLLLDNNLSEEIDGVSAEVGYSTLSRHMVVDLELPNIDVIPEETSFKYVKSGDRIDAVARHVNKRNILYAGLISQVALKCVDTVFRGGMDMSVVQCLTLNGMLDTIDPSTGRDLRVCLLSVRITSDDFAKLNLQQVQPEQCLKSLKATVSRSPAELLAVKPIFELDMVDPRFIDSSDILSGLDTRPNLMELSPGEFESLITNLFAKMGLDTRQTQASRDGGVDCVAFDQRPVFGGKVVIQAKRYKNTVGVSAVRDLFGTVQNEGASKGLLVTTSGYGKASYEFARGKPLELLDGSNLLHLLKEHAEIDAKIVVPDEWKDLPIHGV